MDIDSIQITKDFPKINGKRIIINSPELIAPFGVQEEYGKFNLKLALNGSTRESRQFADFIRNLEKRLQVLAPTIDYHSNVKVLQNYDPLLTLRIQKRYNNLEVNVKSKNKDRYLENVHDIKKGDHVKCRFQLEKIWTHEDKSGCIFRVLDIELI